jgi:hypothetical protein
VGGTWEFAQKLVSLDRDEFDYFGANVAISGDTVVVGAHGSDDEANDIYDSGSAWVTTI